MWIALFASSVAIAIGLSVMAVMIESQPDRRVPARSTEPYF